MHMFRTCALRLCVCWVSVGAVASAQSLEDVVRDLDRRLRAIEQVIGDQQDLSQTLERLREQAESRAAADPGMKVSWRDGLRLEDEDVQLRFGGRIHTNFTFGDADDAYESLSGNLEDAVSLRRARFSMSGSVYDDSDFKIQFDFAGGDADFKDVFMNFHDVPVAGDLTVGQFKEPFSLEEMMSSNDNTFVERAVLATFVPSRSTGIGSTHSFADGAGTFSVGVFKPDTDSFGDGEGDGESAVTARVTFAPIHDVEARRLVHVGAGASRRSLGGADVELGVKPGNGQEFDDVLEVMLPDVDDVDLVGLEGACVFGPFSLQAETVRAEYDSNGLGETLEFDGSYLQLSYLLTGETRPHRGGIFRRVKPADPVFGPEAGHGGWGAWEIAARLSDVHLSDGSVAGGEMENTELGVNWYLSNTSRVMLHYVRSELSDGPDGEADVVIMQFQRVF